LTVNPDEGLPMRRLFVGSILAAAAASLIGSGVGARQPGGWQNDIAAWMETEPDLCTVYALIAQSYCRPEK
jgi:hypothetical protein